MDDCPLAALSHPDCHRVHDAAAIGRPVAGLDVDVQTRQAVGAVVAVIAPRVFRNDSSAADLADERVAAGVGLIIAFFKDFAFVFAIHEILLLKMTLGPSGGMACV